MKVLRQNQRMLFLFLAGLLVNLGVAAFQHSPGYMDADYYYAGGLQLVGGRGLTEPYLWHYLDDPTGLPHPSHTYWMPLASLLAAAGLTIAPTLGFAAARLGFILVAACVPPLTAALAFSLTQKEHLARTAGLLAAFSGFYAAFLPVTDTFGLYMLGGSTFLWLMWRFYTTRRLVLALPLGLLAGLMHLARADGLMWLALFLLCTLLLYRTQVRHLLLTLGLGMLAYLVVMSPWYIRNLTTFGTLLAPGGGRALWLTSYDRLFAYPPQQVNFQSWLQAGWQAALEARWWALGINLQNALAVQMGIFLLPFVLIALWQLRQHFVIRLGVFAWLLTFFAMTFIFPFAGARGGFFHSGAALQPLWWALAPLGLSTAVTWAVKHIPTWREERAQPGFHMLFVGMSAFLTFILFLSRVIIPGWDDSLSRYASIESQITAFGAPKNIPVIVSNPPGYYLASGRPAIALPDGNVSTLLALRARFNARYLILDEDSTHQGLMPVYESAQSANGLQYLGEVDGARIFQIP